MTLIIKQKKKPITGESKSIYSLSWLKKGVALILIAILALILISRGTPNSFFR